MSTQSQKMVSDMFEQAMESFNGALKTSVKIQEESAKWWQDLLTETGSAQDCQKRVQSMAGEAIPTAQKNVEESIKVIDQGWRNSMDLLKQAFETGQCDSIAELQSRTQQLWETTLSTVRTNAQAMVQANAKAVQSWANFARTNATNGKTATASDKA